MGNLVRVGEVLLILVLAMLTLSLVMAIGRPETGALEKVAMLTMIGACVFAAAKVGVFASRVRGSRGSR